MGGEAVGRIASQVSAEFLNSHRVASADRAHRYEIYVECIESLSIGHDVIKGP